jgi:hypothetical protein
MALLYEKISLLEEIQVVISHHCWVSWHKGKNHQKGFKTLQF